jgi:hypothetical protein
MEIENDCLKCLPLLVNFLSILLKKFGRLLENLFEVVPDAFSTLELELVFNAESIRRKILLSYDSLFLFLIDSLIKL